MGWNDHVEFYETECLKCGEVYEWEYWDDVAKQRYVGRVGELLNVDANKSGKCPHCGSTDGHIVDA
jgi:NAD-dependent SIR2 family protein deacetylase